MMDRRAFLCGTALGTLYAPLAVEAQQAGKVWRIGVIINSYSVADAVGPTPRNEYVVGLLRGLRDLGYVYGRDFVTESRSTEARIERSRAIAAELAGLPVDVIVAAGPTLFGVKQAGITTPVVMIGAGDPVQAGFVTSLAHPGGSFTGMSLASEELDRKRLQLLTELVPGALRVAVLRGPGSDRTWKEIQEAARLLKREVLSLQVQSAGEIEGAFRAATERRASALLVIATAVLDQEARQVVEQAATHRLPTMYTFRNFYMGEGGLISYGVDLVDTWRRAAVYVDKILKGAKPADLPVEQPTKFELVINLKTAKALGLTIPQSVIVRADEIIQ
jgi:putative ABC transport system substrate-binding protein